MFYNVFTMFWRPGGPQNHDLGENVHLIPIVMKISMKIFIENLHWNLSMRKSSTPDGASAVRPQLDLAGRICWEFNERLPTALRSIGQ